jgi:hypothetical protein
MKIGVERDYRFEAQVLEGHSQSGLEIGGSGKSWRWWSWILRNGES